MPSKRPVLCIVTLAALAGLVIELYRRRDPSPTAQPHAPPPPAESRETATSVNETPNLIEGQKAFAGEGGDSEGLAEKYRRQGRDFLMAQEAYTASVRDLDERNNLQLLFTHANRLWLAAVLSEMAVDETYADTLADLLNDANFRDWLTATMSQLLPRLTDELKAGKRVYPPDLEELFSDAPDFVTLFEEDVRPRLPADFRDRFEPEIGRLIAGELLKFRTTQKDAAPAESNPESFLWDVLRSPGD